MRKQIVTFLEKLKDRSFSDLGQADPRVSNRNIEHTHWLSLPNVKTFSLKIKDFNSLLEIFDIKKRNTPTFTYETARNGKYNVYMVRQIRRLRSMKHDPIKFFRIVRFLIARSKIFRVSAINKTMVNWYKKIPLHKVFEVSRKVDRLIKTNDSSLDYRRVYIPKGEKGYRPLGVPTLEWRILLQMYNNFLYIFLEEHFSPSQHGFIPGRGCNTAWKEIFEKVTSSKYVMEYDLKNYFETINLKRLYQQLIYLGVPEKESRWMYLINSNAPKLPDQLHLDEMESKKKAFLNMDLSDPVRNANFIKANFGNGRFDTNLASFITRAIARYSVLKGTPPMNQSIYDSTINDYKGLPQGSNLSPLLSNVPLLRFFLRQNPSVSYADDGIFYSDNPFRIWGDELYGITTKYTRWIKKDGVYVSKLKFLGIVYDGKTLRAETRKGSTLLADEKKVGFGLLNNFTKYMKSPTSLKGISKDLTWESIISSRWAGYLQSRMYSGSWTLDDFEQDFLYHIWKLPYKSWGHSRFKPEHNIYNAGSYASHFLIKALTNVNRKSYISLNFGKQRIRKFPDSP